MWMRIAAHYPVWYEPEPLALYRLRPRLDHRDLEHNGESFATREHIEQIAGRFARAPTAAARRRCAEWALVQARALAAAGDRSAALVQLREALLSDHSPRVALRAGRPPGGWSSPGERDRL